MPLADLKTLIEDSENNGYALAGFNVANIEMIQGVIEAACSLGVPVILNVHPDHLKYISMEIISASASEAAFNAKIPVVLHLDYAGDLAIMRKAISCGFTSLMYVAPGDLDFERVLEETRIAAELAHQNGLMIESEFSPISGSSNTDAGMAQVFIKETGVDILSPLIGTSHGGGKANLDLELLKSIKQKAKCYISLHGGSGVEDNVLQQAISLGINKASVYSQISKAAIGKIKACLQGENQPDMVEASGIIKEAIRDMAINRLKITSMQEKTGSPKGTPASVAVDSVDGLVRDVTKRVMKKMAGK